MRKLYTLGYSGMRPDGLLAIVEDLDAVVLDIRFRPDSRNPEWNKKALIELLGDRYRFAGGSLGNVNYKVADLGAVKLHDVGHGIDLCAEFLAEANVVLLCACPSWWTCHRLFAAQAIHEATGCAVHHLDPLNKQRFKSDEASTQYALFEDATEQKQEQRQWDDPG